MVIPVNLNPLSELAYDVTRIMRTEHLIALFFLFLSDFVSGIIAAYISGNVLESKRWINGVLRKALIFLIIFCLGIVSAVVEQPYIYFIFLFLFGTGELKSIFENLEKAKMPGMGEISTILNTIIEHILKKIKAFGDKFK